MFLLIVSFSAGPCKRIDVFGVTWTLWQILFNSRLKVFLPSTLILFQQLSQRSFRYPNVIFFFHLVNSICILRHRRALLRLHFFILQFIHLVLYNMQRLPSQTLDRPGYDSYIIPHVLVRHRIQQLWRLRQSFLPVCKLFGRLGTDLIWLAGVFPDFAAAGMLLLSIYVGS